MLMPKRVKYRKVQRGSNAGLATTNNKLDFGDFALQVQKPTAFGDRRHAGFHRAPHRLAHRHVLGELPRMELRVAAPQIEGACPPGQLAITQGAEKGQLATQVLERAQILLVIERERLVTRDGDHMVYSRIGLKHPCIYFDEMRAMPEDELKKYACIIIDEAQFLQMIEQQKRPGPTDD